MRFFNWNFVNIFLAIINPIPYTSYAIAYGMQLKSPTELFELSTWHLASSSSIELGLLYGIPQYAIIMFISATVLPSTISGFKVLLSKRESYREVLKLVIYILCALSAAIIAGTIAWSATATHTPVELLFTTISTFSFVVFSFLTRFLGSKRIFELVDRLMKGDHLNQFKIRAQLLANNSNSYHATYFFNKYRILHYIGLVLAINTLFTWPIFAAQGNHFLDLIEVSGSLTVIQFFSYLLSVSSWMFYASSSYHAPALLDIYFRDILICYKHNGLSYSLLGNVFSKIFLLAGFYFATYSLQGLAQYTVDQHLLDYLGAQNSTLALFLILQAHFNTSTTSAGASLPLLINHNKKKYTDQTEVKLIDLALY
jgi:hypothetical protein